MGLVFEFLCDIIFNKDRFRKAPKAVRIVLPIVIMILLAAVCLYIDFATDDIVWKIASWAVRAGLVALGIYLIVKIAKHKK